MSKLILQLLNTEVNTLDLKLGKLFYPKIVDLMVKHFAFYTMTIKSQEKFTWPVYWPGRIGLYLPI